MTHPRPGLARATALAMLLAATLAACGGSGGAGTDDPTPPSVPAQTRVDLLASSPRGIDSIAFAGNTAYVSLSNSAIDHTAVMKSALPLKATSTWTDVNLGACALGTSNDQKPLRAPRLTTLGTNLWLFQQTVEEPEGKVTEHALCALDATGSTFTPRDSALQNCYGGYCSSLWMTELKQVGTRLYTNAGAGLNLFASDDQGATWRVLLGQFDSMICTHSAFNIVGDRVLSGGECPLDDAFIRSYQLSPDGSKLASRNELAVTVPELENRNVQFIEQVPNSQRVFAGVEGGLLRSDDGGRSFKFVIQYPLSATQNYPYIRSFLSLSSRPSTLVAGGFDKATAKPFLVWSNNGGDTWTDISSLLPGYVRAAGAVNVSEVTSLIEDPQGRIIVTMNEDHQAKGRLFLLTLGQP